MKAHHRLPPLNHCQSRAGQFQIEKVAYGIATRWTFRPIRATILVDEWYGPPRAGEIHAFRCQDLEFFPKAELDRALEEVERLREKNQRLQREVERLQQALEEARGAPKRQDCQRRDKTTAISPVLLSNKTRHWRGRGTRLYTSF
jgi:hypothetical protein